MFPQLGRIHAAAFSDEILHTEVGGGGHVAAGAGLRVLACVLP